jgi:hypothetical protein
MMFNMQTISTRDLAHRAKEVREMLSSGKTLQWSSRGRLIATLAPPAKAGARVKRDLLARAKAAGAVNDGPQPVSQSVYDDRG